MPEPEKVTAEQAGEALRALYRKEEPEAETEPEPEPTPEPSPETPAEPGAETEAAPESAAQGTEPTDDVASLRKRLQEREAEIERVTKSAQERADAIAARASQNERILRDRMLRKASIADRARQFLKRARGPQGVTEAETDALIAEMESTMNPASPSYVPPSETRGPDAEDSAIVLNGFLNEKAMSVEEADRFGQWMRSEANTALSPIEQAVAGRDLDGFLRIAHNRYLEGQKVRDKEQRRNEAVEAARVVQRQQRETARAASSAPPAPRKTGLPSPQAIDYKSLKPGDVSTLLRNAVEEARRGD